MIRADLREWAQAFCDRDTEKIVQMTSKEVQSNLEKIHILWMDGDTPSFGWSSPWPWGAFGSFFGGTGEEMDGYWAAVKSIRKNTFARKGCKVTGSVDVILIFG